MLHEMSEMWLTAANRALRTLIDAHASGESLNTMEHDADDWLNEYYVRCTNRCAYASEKLYR